MSASPEALTSTLGANHPAVSAIIAANNLVRIGMRETLVGQPVDPADPMLHDYLRAQILRSDRESLYAVFVDCDGRYLRDEFVGTGGRNSVRLSVRALIHRALDSEAAGMLLAHNHPSGDCSPSRRDILDTRKLVAIFKVIDLSLVDHLIITKNRIYSLAEGKEL